MTDHKDQISILIFGSKYPPATFKCTSAGINAAIDYLALNDIDADIDATNARFKQAATYYLRKSIGDLIDDLMDSLTALGALCVVLYGVEPQYQQLTDRIHMLMQNSQNLFDFQAAATVPMMPRRGEDGYLSDDDMVFENDNNEYNNQHTHSNAMQKNDDFLDADDFFDYDNYDSD